MQKGRSSGGSPKDGADKGRDGANRDVVALKVAMREGQDILTPNGYAEVAKLLRTRLPEFGNRKAMADLDIRPFGEFWELRLKGGYVGKINLRVYFADVPARGEIVVLKAYKKEEGGRTSPYVMITLEDRLEDYLLGKLQVGAGVYRRATE